jgi:hypothetical protein
MIDDVTLDKSRTDQQANGEGQEQFAVHLSERYNNKLY